MKLLRFWDVVWWFYESDNPNWKLIIVAVWAPSLFDIDNLRNVQIFLNSWYDVIVPEYYWFCRSWWLFTPENCIKTLIDTKNIFKSWKQLNVYTGEKYKFNYKDFIFVWMSFWWWVVWWLPKFDTEIKNIAMIYPVIEYSTFWKRWVVEDKVSDFIDEIDRWFSEIFRWYNLPIWNNHFSDNLWLTPFENIDNMENINLFLSHWTEDKSIYYKKTKEYYETLNNKFPNWNFVYKEYKWLWHDINTMNNSAKDIIKFFDKN